MTPLQTVARRYQHQRRAVAVTHSRLVPLILEARQTMSLRAIAEMTGLSFARIHQIEQEAARVDVLQRT